MKLIHAKRTRSLRVLWMLEEMGLDYALEVVPFPPTKNPDVLVVNPIGSVPVLIDGDVVMTESNAILDYLGRRYGPTLLVPDVDAPEYWRYQEFLHFGEASLAASLSHMVRTRFFAPDDQKDNWTVRTIPGLFLHRLQAVERALQTRPYLAGDQFTAADISVTYALVFGALMRLRSRYPEVVKAYLERTTARDAYRRAAAL
jgi:glutathione S-transferase